MDILPIIQSLFKAHNFKLEDNSIESFFQNGISLPQFIAFSFDIESIPGITKNPKTWYQKNSNNEVSVHYLCKNNSFFGKFQPSYSTEKSRESFLYDILAKQTFKMTQQEILEAANKILLQIGIQYKSYNDMINLFFIQSILYVLTDYNMQISTNVSINVIKKTLEKLDIPILDNFLSNRIFPIQIQLIYQKYNSIVKSKENQRKKEEEISINEKFDENKLFESELNLNEEEEITNEEEEFEIQDAKMEEKDDDDNENANQLKICEDEKLEDEALLKTINFLSKQKFSDEYPAFTKFKQTLLNDFIPRFVMNFFNITTIKKVQLSEKSRTNILTKRSIKNVYSVIKFLATKEKTFDFLVFDFYTPFERESSAKLLFKNFLNFFFLTQPREEMIERLEIFIGESNEEHRALNMNMPRYKLLIQTMRFISKKPDEFIDGILQMHQMFFQHFNIPIVFHNNQWNTYANDGVLPDSYFYQIKFLFNEWDSNSTTYPMVELLLRSKYKIKKWKVPRYDIITSSIKAKTVTPESTIEDDNKDKNENDNENLNKEEVNNTNDSLEIKKNKILRLFKERYKITKSKKNGIDESQKNDESKEEIKSELSEDAIEFWDQQSENEIYDNGIIRKEKIDEEKAIHFNSIKISTNEIVPFQEEQNKLNNENIDFNSSREFALKMLNSHSNKETEIHKLFIYDEKDKEWKFDSGAFQAFIKSKRLNANDIKTPLVFVVNSDEKNVIDFNSHFIHGLYPKLEKEEQIFVYALCDKTLTMLSMKSDFNDAIKASTKPIFLHVHVPKSKEKNPRIQTILSQINCFLISISSLSIVIMKDHVSQDQVRYYQRILSISKYALKGISKEDQKVSKNNSIYLINIPNVEYNESKAACYHNNPIFNQLINENDNNEIFLIDVNNVETFDHFFDSLSTMILSKNMNFAEIEQQFSSFYGFEMCLRYIEMRTLENWSAELRNTIIGRYLTFVSKNKIKSSENLSNSLSYVYNEIIYVSPRFDYEFIKEYQSIILSMRKNISQMNRKEIGKELSISADYDISFLFALAQNDDYCTHEKLSSIKRNHEVFLMKEYHDIVKLTNNESMFDLVFEDNLDLISQQLTNDRDKLEKMFKDLMDVLQIKNAVKENDPQVFAKKNTNYMLKETENLREIKVAVQIKKDLTSIIEQDF